MQGGYLLPLLLLGAAPSSQPASCEPERVVVQTPGLALNSTYISSSEPPARYRAAPKGYIKVRFGRAAIDEYCGRPPCGRVFLGCTRGDLMVLPDPDNPDFARITRHELGHFNGWPATHGD